LRNELQQDEFLQKSLKKLGFMPTDMVKSDESINARRRLIEDERVLLTCDYYGEDLQIINGNTSAAIWWTKSRMGWKETRDQNVNVATSDDLVKRIQAGRDRVAKMRAIN